MTRAAAVGEANDLTQGEHRDPLVGTVLDRRFRMDRLLAAGGFGAIYRATDLRSDAEVAIKVLHAKLTRDPMVVARFRREGKMLANLRDPHTITAYEFGEAPDGTLYIVMELLHGESLYQRFRTTGPLPWRRVVHIARGVCSSLAEAHAAGIVHRDLKPANIHLETRGNDPDFAKVLDFGIAKIVQGTDHEVTQLTQTGTMIGTIDYMSPEQMVGGEMTAGSDIYTLGVVIYEMIAGRTPFADAQTATAILAAVLTQTPDPLSRYADVPPTLEQIVARCLEREQPNRYTDISELAAALAGVASAGLVRANPAVPSTGFDQLVLSTEATRIDVRFSESSQPVLDARGPRHRPGAGRTPSPAAPAALPQAQLAPVRGAAAPVAYPPAPPVGYPVTPAPYPVAPAAYPPATPVVQPVVPAPYPAIPIAYPAAPVGYPAAPVGSPYELAAAPVAPAAPVRSPHGRAAVPAAYAVGSQHAIDARGLMPRADGRDSQPVMDLAAWQRQHQQQLEQAGIAPRTRASTANVRSYDMSAAATHDAMVRRIIWIALLVCGAIVAFAIASH
jgi:eukaryotic-like serine/threonine-protein kinase